MPFGYKLVPVDLYDLMLAKLREPVKVEPSAQGDVPQSGGVGYAGAAAGPSATPQAAPLTDPADVLVALDNGQTVGVPSVVVNACIHEARGNDVVLERQLIIAARQIALGMDPQHVAMQMRAGEQVEV